MAAGDIENIFPCSSLHDILGDILEFRCLHGDFDTQTNIRM